MLLNELFNTTQAYPLEWDDDFAPRSISATAELGRNSHLVVNFNGHDKLSKAVLIEFAVGDTFDATGRGNEFRIFNTVLSAIVFYVNNYHRPDFFVFSAKGTSRNSLYQKLIQKFAPKEGYQISNVNAMPPYLVDQLGWYDGGEKLFVLKNTRAQMDEGIVNNNPKYVTRIDSKPIKDFGSNLNSYKHTDDWSQSGVDTGDDSYWVKRNIQPNTSKGLYAGDPHRTALYATGNANETRYVEFTQNSQPIVYFDKKDIPKMRNRKTYLSVFDASKFKKLPTGEYFSSNPGQFVKQTEISDPFQYITDQGWIVRVTNNLEQILKQAQTLQKAGKIAHFGAEGMNESSVVDTLDEDWRKNVAGLATAATLAYGGYHNINQDPNKQPISTPVTTQSTPDVPQAQQDPVFQDVNKLRDYLIDQAKAAGIRGQELAHFIAQMAHETANWVHMIEQPPLGAKNPERYFARKYENKKILGNVKPGDGNRFRGRGYVHLTGRDNYTRIGRALGIDLVSNPDLAAEPEIAAKVAIWFWKNRVTPHVRNFDTATVRDVTKRINPAQKGAEERQAQFQKVVQR